MEVLELGEWKHGWQCRGSRTRNRYFRDHVLLLPWAPRLCDDHATPGGGQRADAFGDHVLAYPRTGP